MRLASLVNVPVEGSLTPLQSAKSSASRSCRCRAGEESTAVEQNRGAQWCGGGGGGASSSGWSTGLGDRNFLTYFG